MISCLKSHHIPDIKEIRVESREESEAAQRFTIFGWLIETCKMIKGVVKPEMMQWDDFAQWNDAEHYVSWRLVIPAFKIG